MATVKPLLIDGSSIRQSADGYVVTEKIKVEAVGGTAIARQFAALNNASVPAIGSAHSVVPGVRVTERSIEHLGADHAHVRVTWQTPTGGTSQTPSDPPVWEIDATIETTTAQKDRDGITMVVGYTYPADYKAVPRLAGIKADDQVVTAEFPQASFALRIQQAENRTVIAVSDDAAAHVGTVNSGAFLGKSPRTWLCTRIQASNPTNLVPTDVTYEFIYNPLSWDIEGIFVDPFIGRPPADIVNGVGIKTFSVIGESNLNNLPI